ncbi:hypothetical protein BKA82DRAFT_4011296 [Pisolithus tinctorius]|nr:hypothetical protein BKA82DRAFT_4011296 [Pisolithus tinctorius]
MATSSMPGHIPALCKWAMTGAWIMCKYARIEDKLVVPPGYLQWFRRHTSGILLGQYDFLTFPVSWARSHVIASYLQWFRRHSGGTVLGQYMFQPNPVSWVKFPVVDHDLGHLPATIYWPGWMTPSRLFTVVQKAIWWDSIRPVYVLAKSMGQHRSRAGGSCLASVLNQLQLAGMDDTLQAIYSGSEGTPVGFYWASICCSKVQSAGPNSQLVTVTWDTYQAYARGPGQMPSLWWLIGMDAQLRLLNVTGLDDGLVFWHPLANA